MKYVLILLLMIGFLLVSCGGADKPVAEAPQTEEDPIQTAMKKAEATGTYGDNDRQRNHHHHCNSQRSGDL